MVSSGRKVARPPSRCFNRPMAFFPSFFVSTTMCCRAPPKAISMATLQSLSVWMRLPTGPWMPESVRASAARMTIFTALEKPSYSFSISLSRRIRSEIVFSCRES